MWLGGLTSPPPPANRDRAWLDSSRVVQLFWLSVLVFITARIQSAANPPSIDSQFVWDNIRTAITVASGTRASEVRV